MSTDINNSGIDRLDERLTTSDGGARGALRLMVVRFRGGDTGALPVLLGLAAIVVIFQTVNPIFLSPTNLTNLLTDSAAIGTIALGIVLVLLVAEIDLSVGSMSGLASAILGVGLTLNGWPLWAVVLLVIFTGMTVGAIYGGSFLKLGMPSFVITLAGLMMLLGLQLIVLGPDGSINLPFDSPSVRFMQATFVSGFYAYLLVSVLALLYLITSVRRVQRRRVNGLSAPRMVSVIAKFLAIWGALLLVAAFFGQHNGLSAPFVAFVILVMIVNVLLMRTKWGRGIYAVGGNAEAARRAGVNVKATYVSVFMACSTLAAVGGLLMASRLASANISSGTGATNLNAIAAAVIGGTSLFGGRGNAYSALLGVIVIMSIANGLTLMNLAAPVRFVITGAVLFLAVAIDSLARRSRAKSGRA